MGLFGGSTKSTTNTVAEPWGESQNYLKNVLAESQNQYQSYNPPYYTGEQVAGFTPNQLAAQRYGQQYARGVQPFIDQSQRSNAFLQDPGQMLDPANNPYVSGMVGSAQDQITDKLMSQVMPGIRAQYRPGQSFGGSREQLAAGNAVEGTARAMGDVATNMYGNAYGQGLNAMLGAQSYAPMMAQLGTFPASLMENIGSQQQAYDQARINANREKFDYYANQPATQLDRYANYATSAAGLGGTQSTQGPGRGFQDALGAGMLGVGAYKSGLFGAGAGAAGSYAMPAAMASAAAPGLASMGTAANMGTSALMSSALSFGTGMPVVI